MPKIAPRACAECRAVFTPKRYADAFCSTKCRKEQHNRAMLRGRAIYRIAYHWRKGRGQGDAKGMFQEMCRVIDEWTAEDREFNLPPPPAHVRRDSHYMTRTTKRHSNSQGAANVDS